MKKSKAANSNAHGRVALCYIRQSFTRTGELDDLNSPERQRANVTGVCDKHGWIPEWYVDVGGHKSGRSEKNRPAWLALKARLGDPDVVALVANDLSRLHRKGWRIGDLIEFLTEHEIDLLLAAPGRDVDTTTMKGRMFLQFGAIIDEFYAEDISQRSKDSILYRKSLGKSIGIPPFGTVRNREGFLTSSSAGAWLLENGTFVAGTADNPPEGGVIWRGYYDAAQYMLTLYATGRYGLEKIAYTLNQEGWAFRDRHGIPRMVWRDDIRRVVSNWPEYGGLNDDTRGKDRRAYEELTVDEIQFNPDRAVFPLDLVRRVAQVRHERSRRPPDRGVREGEFLYALSGITYCAHCEQLAQTHNSPRLRSRLGGKGARRTFRDVPCYRHKSGAYCGCKNRSVHSDVYEADFARLIQLLAVRPEALDIMMEMAIQADSVQFRQDVDIEKKKEETIALCHKRIDAAINLYKDGEIDRDEYLQIRETNEREIAHWQGKTTDTERLAVELSMCVKAVDELSRLWEISDSEDRRALAHSLFDEIVYDLDARQIVSFRLKAWADRFLMLRVGLSEVEQGLETQNPPFQGVGTNVPPRRFGLLFQP